MVIPVGGWVSKDAASISTVAVLLDERLLLEETVA